MLVKVDYSGKNGSIYKCDRCQRRIYMGSDDPKKMKNRYRITITDIFGSGNKNTTLRSFDLCKHCMSKICWFIDKGVIKNGHGNE